VRFRPACPQCAGSIAKVLRTMDAPKRRLHHVIVLSLSVKIL
jgi:hypothetical protein